MKRLIKCQKITRASNQSESDWENMLITSHLTWAHTVPCISPPALVTDVLHNEQLWLTDAEKIIVLFAFFFNRYVCVGALGTLQTSCSSQYTEKARSPHQNSHVEIRLQRVIELFVRFTKYCRKVVSKSRNKDKLHYSTTHFSYFSNLNIKLFQQ